MYNNVHVSAVRVSVEREAYLVATEPSLMATYPPPSLPGGPSMRVELHLSCKKLRDADVFSKSDPLVAVYTYNKSNDQWNEVRAARQIVIPLDKNSTMNNTNCRKLYTNQERSWTWMLTYVKYQIFEFLPA